MACTLLDLQRADSVNILVVDDHADTAAALAALFGLRGHIVRVEQGPLSALATLRNFHPDVAILDLGLPDMDGYELAEHLRVNGSRCRLVVVTGCAERDARRCAKLGIAGFFMKPVALDQLVAAVEGGG